MVVKNNDQKGIKKKLEMHLKTHVQINSCLGWKQIGITSRRLPEDGIKSVTLEVAFVCFLFVSFRARAHRLVFR